MPRYAGALGRTTQVWDAVVGNEAGGAKIALFRCTQMVLWQIREPTMHRFFFRFFLFPRLLAEGTG